MKRLLYFSLVVNLALLAFAAWRRPQRAPLPNREIRVERSSIGGGSHSRQKQATARAPGASPWSAIENSDIRQYIANLRSIGCPEATIRDIATMRICRAYREKLLQIEAEMAQLSDTQNVSPSDWQKIRAKQQDLRDDMHSELESVLGQDWVALSSALNGWPNSKSDLTKIFSVEKRSQLREVDKAFRGELDALREKQMIHGLENDEVNAYKNLERQKREAQAAVLSPQELEEYLYRNSPAADYVRRNLPEAKSENEYRAMVKLALEMEMSQNLDSPQRRYGLNGDTDTTKADVESQQKRQDYEQRLKELLGDDRIAEQQAAEKARADAEVQAQEERNRQQMQRELTTMAAEVGVNAESANRFFERLDASKADLTKKFEELERSLAGSAEAKQKQMEAAIKAELNRMAIETMGDKGPAVVEKMIKRDK